ncbi:MAG: flagellar hook assembly protein FlgD [Porticoccaceae bacterium]|nr:flagellar hook assembly protein FlgD [Porticoccaceae bacterium]
MPIENPFNSVSGVSTAEQLTAARQRGSNDPNNLGVKDFLTLMVAQLRNQDPTKPQDSSQFLAQIAQFGTVSGIDELNGAVGGLVNSLSSNQGLQAASLVGRDVIANYNIAPLAEGGELNGVVELPTGVNGLTVEVADLAGNLISRVQLGPQSGGVVPFTWDGTNLEGDAVTPGPYQVTASASINGKAEAVPAFTRVRIDSISLSGSGDPVLNLEGGATMKLSEIREFY